MDKDTLRFLLGRRLQHCLKDETVTIDWGGHFRNGTDVDDTTLEQICNWSLFFSRSTTELKALDQSLGEAKLPNRCHLDRTLSLCKYCGENLRFDTNGKELRCLNPCPFSGGVREWSWELNVPSGCMVVGNDFRRLFRVVGAYDVNVLANQMRTSLRYANVGLSHGFVGNTCPAVYRRGDSRFFISRGRPRDATPVFNIRTDLWWYSIADAHEYARRISGNITEGIMLCRPGVYAFRHRYHLIERDKPGIFTDIEWIRPPDQPRNYLGEFASLDHTAGQSLACNYDPARNLRSIVSCTEHMLCRRYDSRFYHPNGWVTAGRPVEVCKPVRIPAFLRRYAWGMEPNCLLEHVACGKLELNKTFTSLAFNMLSCMVVYGVHQQDVNTTLRIADRCLHGLADKYPDRVPENCKNLL